MMDRRKRIRPVSPARLDRAKLATLNYADAHGVEFDSCQRILGSVNCWPKRGDPIRSEAALARMRLVFSFCFWCDLGGNWHSESEAVKLDLHHIFGGTAGRSDELTNLFPCHHFCHMALQSEKIFLGRVLFKKWHYDRVTVNWPRLCLLRGSFLPDLITNEGPTQ